MLLLLTAAVIHRSSVGRQVRALSEHPQALESLGVSQRRVATFAFIVATLFAVFAGVLVGYETNLQPTMGNSYTIKAFAAMVLGGLGNIWGALCGSYILGLIENLSVGLEFNGFSIPAGYKDAFAFVVILLMLLVRPQGLFNKSRRNC